ncbi:MAG: hypothetical protein IT561_10785 [Alphaproteobacteria bacterium]|nr:hypothetical protein [Alphaproteobacteria bacterium]
MGAAMDEDPLIAFHAGRGTDRRGRRVADVLAFDDRRLEAVHDYIQWLFPLAERSAFNPDAPLLTREAAARFAEDPVLRRSLLAALDRMLAFYGFARAGEAVADAPDLALRSERWLRPGDHNHLRLSRIVRCLAACGQPALAASLRDRLVALADAAPGRVTPATRAHWRALPPAPGRGGDHDR